MKILVTGAAGYIGSHTLVALHKAGHGIVALDNFCNSKPEALQRVHRLTESSFPLYTQDLRDKSRLDECSTGKNPTRSFISRDSRPSVNRREPHCCITATIWSPPWCSSRSWRHIIVARSCSAHRRQFTERPRGCRFRNRSLKCHQSLRTHETLYRGNSARCGDGRLALAHRAPALFQSGRRS